MTKLHFDEAMNRLSAALDDAIRAACREAQLLELAEPSPEDLPEGFQHPYKRLVRTLQHGLHGVRSIQRHTHDWGGDDYCRICGADGRA